MLEGLVQHDHPLTLQHILERMRRGLAGGEVVTLTEGGETTRARYKDLVPRIDRLGAALKGLGVEPGDRVATFAWNTQQHLEIYLAAPCLGAVLHTLNIRLFPDQLAYIVNHAQDKVIFVDASLVQALEKVSDQFEHVEQYVVIGDCEPEKLSPWVRYEDLLADAPDTMDWPEIDDRQAAGLCYTSGTTGNPKGVLYSHRSNILHSLTMALPDAFGITMADRILPVVPMFHANAWGIPYGATLIGASLIMPGRFLQPEPLARLIEREKVTLSAAVPTIWMDLLGWADEHKPDLSSLKYVPCGGSAVPESLMRAWEERHGVRLVQAWGMTETSPLGSVARPPRGFESPEAWDYRPTAGKIMPLVEARLMGPEGEVEWDGVATGELQVRGPWVARDYFEDPAGAEKFQDGWLRTGDIAAITPDGYIRITDRTKDVIKSGGEWISSVELENHLMSHPDVAEAAVVAMPDERWAERPLACVVLKEGCATDADSLRSHLEPRVARWWLPDAFAVIEAVPKTATGKFDKKVLRAQLADGDLEVTKLEHQPAR
jgi:fatty-acyl-CoA synthase